MPQKKAIAIKMPKQKQMAIFSKKNAQKLAKRLKPHVGKKMILYGGGLTAGGPQDVVTLKSAKATPVRYYVTDRAVPPKAKVKAVKEFGRAMLVYNLPDDYQVTTRLSGPSGSRRSLFCSYTQARGKRPSTCKRKDFNPHLGSWKLAVIK